jgi:hypothetical protein
VHRLAVPPPLGIENAIAFGRVEGKTVEGGLRCGGGSPIGGEMLWAWEDEARAGRCIADGGSSRGLDSGAPAAGTWRFKRATS